jgi:hypothetical protein
MGENSFLRSKMHFTLGLLGALFALHPFYPTFDALSFVYMGKVIPVSYALITFGVLLAGATYFFAAGLAQDNSSNFGQKVGNLLYAMALTTVPVYAGLYLTTRVENYLDLKDIVSDARLHSPLVTFGILGVWVFLWLAAGFVMRHWLSKRDWSAKIDALIDQEFDSLSRAKLMLEHDHYDLCIIQCERAVLSRLKMACLKNGIGVSNARSPSKVMHAGILDSTSAKLLEGIFEKVNVARSTTPATIQQATDAMAATKQLLASTKV